MLYPLSYGGKKRTYNIIQNIPRIEKEMLLKNLPLLLLPRNLYGKMLFVCQNESYFVVSAVTKDNVTDAF